jgi:hypothetical protein
VTTFVKIMVKEELPENSVQVVPHITPVMAGDEEGLLRALEHTHKVVYCGSRQVGEQVRDLVSKTDGLEEMPRL